MVFAIASQLLVQAFFAVPSHVLKRLTFTTLCLNIWIVSLPRCPTLFGPHLSLDYSGYSAVIPSLRLFNAYYLAAKNKNSGLEYRSRCKQKALNCAEFVVSKIHGIPIAKWSNFITHSFATAVLFHPDQLLFRNVEHNACPIRLNLA